MRFFVALPHFFFSSSVVDMKIHCARCFSNDLEERVKKSRNVLETRPMKIQQMTFTKFVYCRRSSEHDCLGLQEKWRRKFVSPPRKTMRKAERTAKDINQINKVQFVTSEKCY